MFCFLSVVELLSLCSEPEHCFIDYPFKVIRNNSSKMVHGIHGLIYYLLAFVFTKFCLLASKKVFVLWVSYFPKERMFTFLVYIFIENSQFSLMSRLRYSV